MSVPPVPLVSLCLCQSVNITLQEETIELIESKFHCFAKGNFKNQNMLTFNSVNLIILSQVATLNSVYIIIL